MRKRENEKLHSSQFTDQPLGSRYLFSFFFFIDYHDVINWLPTSKRQLFSLNDN